MLSPYYLLIYWSIALDSLRIIIALCIIVGGSFIAWFTVNIVAVVAAGLPAAAVVGLPGGPPDCPLLLVLVSPVLGAVVAGPQLVPRWAPSVPREFHCYYYVLNYWFAALPPSLGVIQLRRKRQSWSDTDRDCDNHAFVHHLRRRRQT